MNAQIDQLAFALELMLGVLILVAGAMIVYLLWLVIRLQKEVAKWCLRVPQVERDRDGRRIKERI